MLNELKISTFNVIFNRTFSQKASLLNSIDFLCSISNGIN